MKKRRSRWEITQQSEKIEKTNHQMQRFEMENKIIPESDAIYFYDKQKHDDQVKAKPWIAE